MATCTTASLLPGAGSISSAASSIRYDLLRPTQQLGPLGLDSRKSRRAWPGVQASADAVLALDIGTGGTKAALVSSTGTVLKTAFAAYNGSTTVEHEADAMAWWNAAVQTIRICLSSSSAKSIKICAISVTGQMQDVILLPQDVHSHPPPVILYSDARAVLEAEEVERLAGGAQRLAQVTGMQQGPTSLLAKLRWLDRHYPDAAGSCRHLLMGGHDYVVGRMCDCWVSDATTASTTGLTSIAAPGSYAEGLLRDVGLAHWLSKLPPLVPPDQPCGQVTKEAALQIGSAALAGLPIFHSCGDAGACTLGCGAGVVGPQYSYVGTSGWVAGSYINGIALKTQRTESEGSKLPELRGPTGVFTLAHPDPSLIFKTGSIMTAGGNLAWASQLLFCTQCTPDARQLMGNIDKLASSIPAGSLGVLYLPFLQGERCPFEDGDARAAFMGLSMNTDQATLLRAVMEGVALALRSARDAMATTPLSGSDKLPLRMVGGGARSPLWPEIMANVFNQNVEVLADAQEVGVKGAAILAGRWLGWHSSLAPSGDWVRVQRRITPSPELVDTYDELFSIYMDCHAALQATHNRLATFRKHLQH